MHQPTSAGNVEANADVVIVRGRVEVRVTGKLGYLTVGKVTRSVRDKAPLSMSDAPLLYDLRAVALIDASTAEALVTATVLAAVAERHPVAICGDSYRLREAIGMVSEMPQDLLWFASITRARSWLRDKL